jgi:hypothetical protein
MHLHRLCSLFLPLTLAALTAASVARAQSSEHHPGLSPEVAAALARYNKEYLPSVPFDLDAALAQLGPGTATIKGTIDARVRDSKKIQISNLAPKLKASPNVLVTLFPVTPYFEEYLKLRKKHDAMARLSPEAFSCRIVTWTHEGGAFEFTGLKPGKYFIESVVYYQVGERVGGTVQQTGTKDTVLTYSNRDISHGEVVVSSEPIYGVVGGEVVKHTLNKSVTGFAEVKTGEPVAKVVLKN